MMDSITRIAATAAQHSSNGSSCETSEAGHHCTAISWTVANGCTIRGFATTKRSKRPAHLRD